MTKFNPAGTRTQLRSIFKLDFTYFGVCAKFVSNEKLSKVLKSLGLEIYKASQPSATRVSEYCFPSPSAQSWQCRDRRKPEVGTIHYFYRMTSMSFYSDKIRQHCTPQAFGQFGALYMHSPDDKYSTQPGFKPSTSEYPTTMGLNEPSGHQVLDQWFKSYDAICTEGGQLGCLQKGI